MHAAYGVKRRVVYLVAVALALPGAVRAEERPAEAILVALANPRPVDRYAASGQIHLTERVQARAGIFARLLFNGRVMILAREGALLRITEVLGATTIHVDSGRVAVTVDRENLHPEDLVEVRTPHAVVTVPSSTLVVEVADASTFTAVGRPIDVFRLDPVSGLVLEPPSAVAADELLTVEATRVSEGVVANR